jgi:hypothetical protein
MTQLPLPPRQAHRDAQPPEDGVARRARQWLLPGLVAGAAFLAVAFLAGALTTTPWAMPDAVAAVLGVATSGYRFAAVPVLVGVAAHLAVSTVLGVLYLAIARRLRLRRGLLVLGAWVFSGVETPISLWGILHTVLAPQTFHYFLDAVPFWASFLGHNVYGLVLGLLAKPDTPLDVPAGWHERGVAAEQLH